MKNYTTFVRMRSGDHLGDAKMLKKGTLLRRILTFLLISVGSRGAVVSAALSERKVAGSIPTIGDFHTVGPCKKAVFACFSVWPPTLSIG